MEEQEIRELLHKEAEDITLAALPAFIDRALEVGKGSYGGICIAFGIAAAATARAMDRTPSGGITGFMAGAVFWEFVREWGVFTPDAPKKMLDYGQMLYPQYEHSFRSISNETWEWLQKEAAENLTERGDAHPGVLEHWQSIVDGTVPFGYTVEV